MKNDRNVPAAVNSLSKNPGGAAGFTQNRNWPTTPTWDPSGFDMKVCTAFPRPRQNTMRRCSASTNSAAMKISLRSLTCLERKKRNSVDADSSAVSSVVGTRPMARAKARNDSPENSPEISRLVMARTLLLLRGRGCAPDARLDGDAEQTNAAADVRASRAAMAGQRYDNGFHGSPQSKRLVSSFKLAEIPLVRCE